jgi:peptide chain release factor subunit 3
LLPLAIEDKREHVNVTFFGHVDAGKSTICGNILFQSGAVSERDMQKYAKEAADKGMDSWLWAYLMDINKEERERGKTVELGVARFVTGNKRFTILDTPGHISYLTNMILGAMLADVGILVISARRGEFEDGWEGTNSPTKQHLALARALGVQRLVVVVNKMDEPTVQWQEERFKNIEQTLRPKLKLLGFNDPSINFVPVSGFTGANIKNRLDTKVCAWYSGPSLFEVLDVLPAVTRDLNAPLRVPVMDRYREQGLHVVGKIETGTLNLNDNLVLMPGKIPVQAVKILSEAASQVRAVAGDQVCVMIKSNQLTEEQIYTGQVLCPISNLVPVHNEFVAKLLVLSDVLTNNLHAKLHCNVATVECTLQVIMARIDPKTDAVLEKVPNIVKKHSVIFAHIKTAKQICMETFADTPQLGRVLLRNQDSTVAYGKIMALGAPKKKKDAVKSK